MQLIRSFSDGYHRVARLYPAILTILPFVWTIAAFAAIGFTIDLPKGAAFVLITICVLYLLASVARSRGKLIEPRLLAKWGGWPSTALLRHRDKTVDPYTKARYHAALEVVSPDLKLPSVDDEERSPEDADAVYRSATRRLIECRRGSEYNILHAENASYGFRRNLLGLRSIGIGIAFGSATLTISAWLYELSKSKLSPNALIAVAMAHWLLPTLVICDIADVVIWMSLIRETFVLQAAREYASALFKTLDNPVTTT